MPRPRAKEGHIYSLPMFSGTQWFALVARNHQGTLLIHFYPARHQIGGVPPALTQKVGDLGIRNGEWRDEGELPGWNRKDWPVPQFRRLMPWEEPSNETTIVTYGENLAGTPTTEVLEGSFEHLPRDGLSGHKAVNAYLKRCEAALGL